MDNNLQGKKVAILATDGFEQSELEKPKAALEEVGATTQVVSPKSGEIKGWDTDDWGNKVTVDVELSDANSELMKLQLISSNHFLKLENRLQQFVMDLGR
jgi:protease I